MCPDIGASVVVALVLAASVGVADAQRRPPAEPNYDAFYELAPIPSSAAACQRARSPAPSSCR